MAPEIFRESDLGRFVVGAPELGVGRLVEIGGSMLRIRYFRGPVENPYVERLFDISRVRFYKIQTHDRVYFPDGRRWRIGRIGDAHPDYDGRYVVALPNLVGEYLSADEFDLRWTPVIEDPYEVLASLGGDSAYLYGPRIDLIAAWHSQKAAALGVEGLLLASVELHDHQLTVVRSVSNDADRRYLLADAVGLGKTVETGALLYQSLRARPKSAVLVLAPDHLRQQWRDELHEKFHIDELTQASIQIRAHEEPATWPCGPVDILIVDEAHHLTRGGPFSPSVLKQAAGLAHRSTDVFLLSATPVRSNEAAFLDLLHLLDPSNYHPDDLESFVNRVKKRDQIAILHHLLTHELDEFTFSFLADQLRSDFSHDKALGHLVDQAVDATDEQRPDRIVRVKNHLSETYRLHHRLLRTRRNPELNMSFGVRGRGRGLPFTVNIRDDTDELRFDLIEDFRCHVAELVESETIEMVQAREALRLLGQACGSLPQAILGLTDIGDESDEVRCLVGRWLRSIGDAWRRNLVAATPDALDETVREIAMLAIAKDSGKVIVATCYSNVARAVSTALVDSRGEDRVAEHLGDHSREDNATSVERWRSNPLCRVLVCDSSAEEGINLQTADIIIHLDLPWDIFRLEQRLGRADRFVGSKLPPVKSMVFTYGEQAYAEDWFLFAADSCGVFDESVSSLQYVLADLESYLLSQVIMGGVSVFDSDIELRRENLRGESDQIMHAAGLDSLSTTHGDLNERLFSEDEDPRLGEAFTIWLNGVGGRVKSPAKGSIKIAPKPLLQIPFSLKQAIAPWLDRELTFSRQTAVNRHVPIVRSGHGLLDPIVAHLCNDDRGSAFAFMREIRDCWPPIPIFRTDFLVRPLLTGDLDQVASEQGLSTWLQIERSALIAPVLETVYMSEAGSEIPQACHPYNRVTGDLNLGSKPDLFDKISAHLDWTATCKQGLARATDLLTTRDSWLPRASRSAHSLRSLIEDRLAALRATDDPRPVDQEIQAFELLAAAVPDSLDMAIDVIGCGVILLADPERIET